MDINMNNKMNTTTQKKFHLYDQVNIESIFKSKKFQCKILFFISEQNKDFLYIIPKTCIKALINKGIAYENEEKMLIECIEKQIFQNESDPYFLKINSIFSKLKQLNQEKFKKIRQKILNGKFYSGPKRGLGTPLGVGAPESNSHSKADAHSKAVDYFSEYFNFESKNIQKTQKEI